MNRKSFALAIRETIARSAKTRTLMIAGLALTMAHVAAQPASAEQYQYKGVDATYPNIQMNLYVTKLSGTLYDATGSIYISNFNAPVKGTFTGSTLTAMVAFNVSYSVQRSPVTGTLSGGSLGVGKLMVSTGSVYIVNKYYSLTFILSPIGGPGVTPPSPPVIPPPAYTPVDFRGSAGFGYTRVDLTMHFQPSGGGTYAVSGQAIVHTIRPQVTTKVLQISGTYNPGSVPARMAVTGAGPQPPGNVPLLTCTMQGKRLACQMSGMRSLGIYSLYITAVAP